METIIIHEDYWAKQHDIALLKLKEPLDLSVRRTLSSAMNPICKATILTDGMYPSYIKYLMTNVQFVL